MGEPMIKGWCPGALRPMPSGDGLVVRVRPRGGRLSQVQTVGLGRLAAAHGNSIIDLTARANVQLRGVTEQTFGALVDGLAGLGLIDGSAEIEANRNIIVTPFWSADDDVQDIAAALAEKLAATTAPRLPGKFGFAIDCGTAAVLSDVSADIRLERCTAGGLICKADGAAYGMRVSQQTAVAEMMSLARWFAGSGGVRNGRGRMRPHLAQGATLPDRYGEIAAVRPPQFSPRPGTVAAGMLVGFEFGQLRAETLIALARHGALRVTPWRMLLIEGATSAPDIAGLLTLADDPLLRVMACSGKPACSQALQPTRKLARRLAPLLPDGATLHVSGCAKGCAMAGATDVTLTGHAGGYDLVRNGRAGDQPQRRDVSAEAIAQRPEILSEKN